MIKIVFLYMIPSCIEKYGLFLMNQQGTKLSVAEVLLNSLLIQSYNKLLSMHYCILIACEKSPFCFCTLEILI